MNMNEYEWLWIWMNMNDYQSIPMNRGYQWISINIDNINEHQWIQEY